MKRLLMLATTLGALACADPLEPGTEWLAGSWRVASRCVTFGTGFPVCENLGDDPSAETLTLTTEGKAIAEDSGVTVLATDYRAGREESEAGMPMYVWFEDDFGFWSDLPGARKFAVSSTTPTDTVWLSAIVNQQPYVIHSQSYQFVRTP